jgi:ribosomal protein S18 acetylase RimI-like enzyme
MQDQIEIRSALPVDTATLVEFNLRMATETEGKRLDSDVLTSGVNAVLDDPTHGLYLVAEVDGELVGSLMVTTEWSDWRNGVFWWIQSVYVRPEHRKRGVFRALYEEVRTRAVNSAGVCGCRLYVEKDNITAQAAYTRRGFTETNYKVFEDLLR